MLCRLGLLAIGHSSGSMTRQFRLPSTGSPGNASPASLVLFAAKTAHRPFPLRIGCPYSRGTTVHHVRSLPSGSDATRPGLAPLVRDARRLFSVETCSSPRFLGRPSCVRPALGLRPGHRASPMRRKGAAPVETTSRAPTSMKLSKLYHTAFTLAVYASQGGSPRHHARLASGWWLTSTGWDFNPLGLLCEVSTMST